MPTIATHLWQPSNARVLTLTSSVPTVRSSTSSIASIVSAMATGANASTASTAVTNGAQPLAVHHMAMALPVHKFQIDAKIARL